MKAQLPSILQFLLPCLRRLWCGYWWGWSMFFQCIFASGSHAVGRRPRRNKRTKKILVIQAWLQIYNQRQTKNILIVFRPCGSWSSKWTFGKSARVSYTHHWFIFVCTRWSQEKVQHCGDHWLHQGLKPISVVAKSQAPQLCRRTTRTARRSPDLQFAMPTAAWSECFPQLCLAILHAGECFVPRSSHWLMNKRRQSRGQLHRRI